MCKKERNPFAKHSGLLFAAPSRLADVSFCVLFIHFGALFCSIFLVSFFFFFDYFIILQFSFHCFFLYFFPVFLHSLTANKIKNFSIFFLCFLVLFFFFFLYFCFHLDIVKNIKKIYTINYHLNCLKMLKRYYCRKSIKKICEHNNKNH